MMYLADVNVVCEAAQSRGDPRVIEWLQTHRTEVIIDPIVLGEIWRGIDALPDGRKRALLTI